MAMILTPWPASLMPDIGQVIVVVIGLVALASAALMTLTARSR